ncbi:MAG: polymer-forming cytoskeletal protein [Flavobacteriales bacterium]|nr:polymer-forming cytoskeletal protein [Flavobacteriales bacterium]
MTKPTEPVSPGKINSIMEGTVIEGEVRSDSNVRIDGMVKGTINVRGRLIVGATGIVEGNVTCQSSDIEGTVKGKINCRDLLSLKATASHHPAGTREGLPLTGGPLGMPGPAPMRAERRIAYRSLIAILLFTVAVGAATYAICLLAHWPFGLPQLAMLAFFAVLTGALHLSAGKRDAYRSERLHVPLHDRPGAETAERLGGRCGHPHASSPG